MSRNARSVRIIPALALLTVTSFIGIKIHRASRAIDDTDSRPVMRIRRWEYSEDLATNVAVFHTVFWDPRDTISLRTLMRETDLVKGKTVLEIGTGSGLIALCALHYGAQKVTATDVNASAIENVLFNAQMLGSIDRLDARLVPLTDSGAFSVIGKQQKFDVIVSNPPWENDKPRQIDDYALYDTDFMLLRSLLKDLHLHLNPGGKAYLAYGCVDAIKTLQKMAPEFGLTVAVADDRKIDELDEVFLPGMLLIVSPTPSK